VVNKLGCQLGRCHHNVYNVTQCFNKRGCTCRS
jgi:hypothetical protein